MQRLQWLRYALAATRSPPDACLATPHAVNFLIDRDPKARIGFASLQSPQGQALCTKHNVKTDLNTMVLIEGSKVHTKSGAALRVLAGLGGLWSLLYVLLLVPRFIRDFCYSLFARNRYRLFGQSESCRRMTPDLRRRFLELTTFATADKVKGQQGGTDATAASGSADAPCADTAELKKGS